MDNPNDITDLLYKHIREELSTQESIQLQNWVNECDENQTFFNRATDIKQLLQDARIKTDNLQAINLDQAWEDLKKMGWESAVEPRGKLRSINWRAFIAAAAVIIVLIGAWWLVLRKPRPIPAETPVVATVSDVEPGKFKAKLILDDGSIIILDSAKNGKLAQQGGTNLLNKDGQLIYEKGSETNKVLYNTLSTSKAQIYTTVLSDGTKVWLNAQSSIRYPVSFNGDVRKVEVTGEVYFEVMPSIALQANGQKKKRPFIVSASGVDIEVLGTHFNVNDYANEAVMKTTLLEGRVKVHSAATNEQVILEPGEQAILGQGHDKALNKTKNIDVDAEVAWRFGYFNFNNADLKTVMRQLERWYDVTVEYQGHVPDAEFLGKIPRELTLSQVLNGLQRQDVHFNLVGKKVIVTP